MRISQRAIPYVRLSILIIFTVASLLFYFTFYVLAGGRLPVINPEPYQVVFQSPINKNLVNQSQVTVNGVPVGRIQNVEVKNGLAQITAGFNERPENAPLHQGVKATIKTKTLINETYIDLTDGNGPEIPTNTVLPPGNVAPPVDTDEIIRALPPQDMKALSGALQSLAVATKDNQSGISQTIGSLGTPTNYVPAALKALNDQEPALRQLSTNTARVLSALDTRRGQIGQLVEDADLVTKTTAGSSTDLANVIRKLTPTLQTAQDASDDLSRLGFALQPVADNLNRASGPLNDALRELPPTAHDLRSLLPYLDSTLSKLPPTLQRVPRFSSDVRHLSPALNGLLDQLNPILAYIEPCAPQIVQSLANTGLIFSGSNINGPLVRVDPVIGLDSINPPAGIPAPLARTFPWTLGNSPPWPQTGQGSANSNIQCKTPLAPYKQ